MPNPELEAIYAQLNRAEAVQDLEPVDKGDRYELVCPGCGTRRAFLYKNGTQIECNRRNNCGFTSSLWDHIQAREGLSDRETFHKLADLANYTLPNHGKSRENRPMDTTTKQKPAQAATQVKQSASPETVAKVWELAKATRHPRAVEYAKGRMILDAVDLGIAGTLPADDVAGLEAGNGEKAPYFPQYGPCLVSPCYLTQDRDHGKPGDLVAVQYRLVKPLEREGKKNKIMSAGQTSKAAFANKEALEILQGKKSSKMFVLVEGIVDFLTVAQCAGRKWPVLGAPGAGTAKNLVGPWAKGRAVLIALDADAPEEIAKVTAAVTAGGGDPLIVKVPQEGAKDGGRVDINDFFCASVGPDGRDYYGGAEALADILRAAEPEIGLGKAKTFREAADSALAMFAARKEGEPVKWPYGWEMLAADGALGSKGLWPGLHVFIGSTGVGKTALGLQFSYKAVREGIPTLYVSTELSEEELAVRIAVQDIRARGQWVAWSKVMEGEATEGDIELLETTYSDLSNKFKDMLTFYVPDPTNPTAGTVSEIKRHAELLYRAHKREKPILVVVDYLQQLQGVTGKEDGARERVGATASALRNMIARPRGENWPGATVVALSSTSRAFYGEVGDATKVTRKTVSTALGAAKESGDVEFAADSCFCLFGSPSSEDGKGVVAVAKRRGPGAGKAFYTKLDGKSGTLIIENQAELTEG